MLAFDDADLMMARRWLGDGLMMARNAMRDGLRIIPCQEQEVNVVVHTQQKKRDLSLGAILHFISINAVEWNAVLFPHADVQLGPSPRIQPSNEGKHVVRCVPFTCRTDTTGRRDLRVTLSISEQGDVKRTSYLAH